ncbi:hypothetical protein [Ralstonia pseudosolanacearum]
MNTAKIKLHTELRESEIQANLSKSKDVDWLAQYPPLLEAINDAKEGRIYQIVRSRLGALGNGVQYPRFWRSFSSTRSG